MEFICPICGRDQNEGLCDHHVASLSDDSDGFDVEVPIYFGWDSPTDDHDEMVAAIHGYLIRLKDLVVAVSATDPQTKAKIIARCQDLPEDDKHISLEAFRVLDAFTDYPDDRQDEIVDALQGVCKTAFEIFYIKANERDLAMGYEIIHSPGLTWTGTNYWAEDGAGCARLITKSANEAMGRLEPILASLE